MSTYYELQPTDGHNSFYKKAMVLRDNDGTESLYSYGTLILVRHPNGIIQRVWDGWSVTTGRHIAAFCGLNKAGYNKLCRYDPNDLYRDEADC